MTRAADCSKAHLNERDFDALDARQRAIVRESIAEFKKANPGKDATPSDPNEPWAAAAEAMADELQTHKKAVLKALKAEDKAAADKAKAEAKPKPPEKRKFDNLPDLADAVAKENNLPQAVADAYIENTQLGISLDRIGKKLGVTGDTVSGWLKKFKPLMKAADYRHVRGGETTVVENIAEEIGPVVEEPAAQAAPALEAETKAFQVEPEAGAEPTGETDANLNNVGAKKAKGASEVLAHDDAAATAEYKRALRGAKGLGAQFNAMANDAGLELTWKKLGEKGQVWFKEFADKGQAEEGFLTVSEAHHEGLLNSLLPEPLANPTTIDRIKTMLTDWFPSKSFKDNVRIYANMAEARAAVPALSSQESGRVQAFVDPSTGLVHLVAENIPAGLELSVFLHEMGVHVGARNILGGRMAVLTRRVDEWLKTGNGIEMKVAARARARVDAAVKAGIKKGSPMSEASEREELVAYFIEEAVKAGITPTAWPQGAENIVAWIKQVIKLYREVLAKVLGVKAFQVPEMSAQDMVDFAYGAANLNLPSRAADTPTPLLFSQALDDFKGATWKEKLVSMAEDKWRAMPGALGWLSTEQLGDRFKSLPAVRKFSETMQRMGGRATEMANASDVVKKKWEKMIAQQGKAIERDFNTLLQDSSDEQVWPDVPLTHEKNKHVANDVDAAVAHSRLSLIYNRMPASVKVLYHEVLADLRSQFDASVAAYDKSLVTAHLPLTEGVNGVTSESVRAAARLTTEKARDKFLADSQASLAATRAYKALWKDQDAFNDTHKGALPGPYFPKVRYGDHVVYFKSPEYLTAEATLARATAELSRMEATRDAPLAEIDAELRRLNRNLKLASVPEKRAAINEEIEQLKTVRAAEEAPMDAQRALVDDAQVRLNASKSQADQYHVEFFESGADAKAREAHLRGILPPGMAITRTLRNQYMTALDSASPAFVARLEQRLRRDLGEDMGEKASKAMRELRLQMLPENSAGKARLKRLGVSGVRNDQTLRAYATASLRSAFSVSRLEYSDQLNDNLNDLRFGEDQDGRLVGNELAMRMVQNLQAPAHNKLLQAASNWTYLSHLGLNASFLATQVTQPFVVSAPVLAGRHGIGASMRALKDAYPALTSMLVKSGTLDIAAAVKAKALTAAEGEMLQGMVDHGRIDTTVRHDLGAASSGEQSNQFTRLVELSGAPAHRLEMVNRVSTALAAYRLEVERGTKNGLPPAEVEARARAYADQIVSETHLNYSPENRARFMHPNMLGGFGRILWQFKSFQQGMVFLVMKNLIDAKRGDPEARRTLAYLMGMQFATAGLTGLPFMAPAAIVATMLYKAFEDDDDERDLQQALRAGIKSVAGDTVADLLTKGVPAALGVDMSKKVGMGDIFLPAPYWKADMSSTTKAQSSMESLWFQLTGGPAMGLAASVTAGLQAASDGNFVKAATSIAPKALGNIVGAADIATRGVRSTKGDTLIGADEFNAAQVALKALGFQSTKVGNMYEDRSAFYEAKGNRDTVRDRLLREFAQARLNGSDVRDVLDEVREFNDRHPDARLTRAALERAVGQRKQQQKAVRGGVVVGKKDRALAQDLGLE